MSAEQRRQLFSVDYQQELQAPFFPTLKESLSFWRKHPPVRELDLHSVYQDVLQLTNRYGRENALFAGLLRFSLDLWALQQEMEGRRHTQELATYVTIEDDAVVFQNKRYPKGTNLQKMYEDSLELITDEKVARYKRENDQVFALYTHLDPWIQKITKIFEQDTFTDELITLGFTWHEVPLTPSLLATIPSLFSSLTSMDDLYSIIRGGKMIKVLMAPEHLLTVSPQHWLHKKGKSTFWWNTRLIVLPDSKETAIIQNGIFNQTPLIGSIDILAFEQTKKHRFRSEQELMQFINVVTTHTDIHPTVLLDMLVESNELYADAGKIDPNVKEGTLDVEPYIRAVEELLKFELQRCEENPEYQKGLDTRLLMITDLIQHKLARLNATGILDIANEYKQTFDTVLHAQTPLRQKHKFFQSALHIDPGFGIKINLSAVDCTVGTLFNGINKVSNIDMKQFGIAVDARYGHGAGEYLQTSAKNGIRSHSQLIDFCNRFKLDHTRFHEGTCRTRGCPSTFVGECNVCPACEMLDNFGVSRDWNMDGLQSMVNEAFGGPQDDRQFSSAKKMGITDFVAGLGNPKLYFDVFLIESILKNKMRTTA